MTKTFSQHRVIENLEKLFAISDSKQVKVAIIEVFQNIDQQDIVPFLLHALESSDPELKADVISICGMFPDVSTAYYLEKYLDDPHPRVRSNAIIALWRFVPYRLKLLMKLNEMLQSSNVDTLLSAIYALGETKMIQEIPRLQELLHHEHQDIHRHAAIALVKMGEKYALDHAVNFVMSSDSNVSRKSLHLLKKLDGAMGKSFHRHLHHRVSAHILDILKRTQSPILEEMPRETLQALFFAYEILGQEREMLEIQEILEEFDTKKDPQKAERKEISEISFGNVSLSDLL